MRILFVLFGLIFTAMPALSEPPGKLCSDPQYGHVHCIRKMHFAYDLCQVLWEFPRRANLDSHFFTRLIWQESRFDPNARSHAGAEGIAQFIPSTARIRKLPEVFNPALALDASARYLSELEDEFGSLGMAAAAYNAGENAAAGFLAGKRGLPGETRHYVMTITGEPAESWREGLSEPADLRLSNKSAFMPACLKLAKKRKMPSLNPAVPRTLPWGVQVASGNSKNQAHKNYGRMTRSCAHLLKNEKPVLLYQRYRAGTRKGYYAVRLGRNDRKSAGKLCIKLRQNQCACAVYRNS